MPDPVLDQQRYPEHTVDLPSASNGGPATARQMDTSMRSVVPNYARTGEYTPNLEDPSAATSGYTPSDLTVVRPGDPEIAGYEILDELGRGGMGVVYKARQIALNRMVALKMILAGAHAKPKDLERFRAEAQAVARFQHPGIVQIYEVGESNGMPYFSLEFVAGDTLSKKISHDPKPPEYAARIVESLALAMNYAHEHGIIHRDLKPANVLLAEDGTPKITDFGLAKTLEADSGQTQAGTVLGTPSYMAPEQANGEAVGPLADVYSLGGILYDLLTGRPPFSGSSVLDTLEMVRSREPVPPSSLAGKLPRDIETIALKCLQKDAARRYQSAGELAADLRRFLENRPILARPVGPLEKGWRWAKRNPGLAGLGTAVAVLLVAVAIITSVMSYNLNVKKNEAQENFRAAKEAEEKEALQKVVAQAARDKALKAQVVTGEQRNLALDVVRGISMDVDAVLGTKQSLAPLRQAIQEKMLSDVNKIRDHAKKNALYDRGEAVALSKLGEIYMQANRVRDAEDHYRRVRAIFEQFIKDNADDPIGRRNLAAISNRLAEAELRLGNAAEARVLYDAALKLRQEWVVMVPGHAAAKQSVAESYVLLGRVHLELGEPETAMKNYQTAENEYSKLTNDITSGLAVQRERIEIRERIGNCLFKLGESAKAGAEYQAVLKDRKELAKQYPQFAVLNRDTALTRLTVGDFYMFDRKDSGRALAEYAPAYEEVAAQAKADPDDLLAKRELSALSYRMGVTIGRLADVMPAGPALRVTSQAFYLQCLAARSDLAKADRKDTRGQIDVMVVLGRLGRAVQVETIAKALLAQAGKDRRVLFQVACGLALAGGGTDAAAERCKSEAFRVLTSLVEEGWKDRVALETDPDLDTVRGDERFTKLVKTIERRVASK